MIRHWKSWMIASLVWCTSHSVSGADLSAPHFDDLTEDYAEIPVNSIEKFVQIYGLVKAHYVEEKSDEVLFESAIKGMVSGVDHYSRYLSAKDYQQLLQYTEGELASVDFELQYHEQLQQWIVQGLQPNADSAKQGLRNGVTVFKIGDKELKNLNQDQINHALSGAIGSLVQLQLAPTSAALNIVRNRKIDTATEAKFLTNQVLIVKVKVFQQETAAEIKKLIEQYQPQVQAVLIDLRNNPGGLLSAAVEASDLFLNQGLIVSTKSRSEGDQQFHALPGFEFSQLKLGILINTRSASAAEVFTAALKDHQRAWVIGEKSYGKGVVQKLLPLNDGDALQITVSRYYTPRGSLIEGIGIVPNLHYPLQHGMRDEQYLEQVAGMLLHH